MIVIPCTRCTSSITATNRATNGHRFVFHSSEIVSCERRYITDEPGVIPFDFTPPAPTPPPSGMPSHIFYPPSSPSPPLQMFSGRRLTVIPPQIVTQSATPPPPSEYLPTPPLELAELSPSSPISSDGFPFSHDRAVSPRHPPRSPPPLSSAAPNVSSPMTVPSNFAHRSPLLLAQPTGPPYEPRGMPAEPKDPQPMHKLRAGDVLFWHHLSRQGEIPGVMEDERARGKDAPVNRKMFDR
jgi:hypothetical protein